MHPIDELNRIERLAVIGRPFLRRRTLTHVTCDGIDLPIDALSLGSENPADPVLAFVGGVHGLERIGSQVLLAFLESLIEQLHWDRALTEGLQSLKLLFIPVVNPVGVLRGSRANGNGVDLMRNAPLNAREPVPFLVGGHRLTPRLPWFRGHGPGALEVETAALSQEIESQLFPSPLSIVLDCHSGFGFEDRIWFPYAHTSEPFEHLAEVYALRQLLFRTYPHLNYLFEPQAHSYLAHGDLWDFLSQRSTRHEGIFLPLTMEMGSWRWVRKNPVQLFRALGLFHPIKPHRTRRVLRRHIVLLEFLIRAVRSYRNWLPVERARETADREAMALWYD